MSSLPKRLRHPYFYENIKALVRHEEAERQRRKPQKRMPKAANTQPQEPRNNVALTIHTISLGTALEPQTVVFANPRTGTLLAPMVVGKVQHLAEKAHSVATQKLPPKNKEKDIKRKHTARDNFLAYFMAIERMGGTQGLDYNIVRYGRRLLRVTAARAAL